VAKLRRSSELPDAGRYASRLSPIPHGPIDLDVLPCERDCAPSRGRRASTAGTRRPRRHTKKLTAGISPADGGPEAAFRSSFRGQRCWRWGLCGLNEVDSVTPRTAHAGRLFTTLATGAGREGSREAPLVVTCPPSFNQPSWLSFCDGILSKIFMDALCIRHLWCRVLVGQGHRRRALGAIPEARGPRSRWSSSTPTSTWIRGTMSPFPARRSVSSHAGRHRKPTWISVTYERFVRTTTAATVNFHHRAIYERVIAKERRGDYFMGATVPGHSAHYPR